MENLKYLLAVVVCSMVGTFLGRLVSDRFITPPNDPVVFSCSKECWIEQMKNIENHGYNKFSLNGTWYVQIVK